MSGIAIAGTGMWGPRLAAAAQRAGLELVTCFCRDEGKRREFAERFGCEAAPSLEDAIGDSRVEGVVLATPNDVHEEQTVACAERGRHVFVEKPIAESVQAGERMRQGCADAGVTLMVGHAFRRLGAARRVKQLIDDGALGRVVLAEANMSLTGSFKPGAWRGERERNPGGPIMQLGIHHVDTLAYWLGPVRRASGRFAHVHAEAEIDDVDRDLRVVAGAELVPREVLDRLSRRRLVRTPRSQAHRRLRVPGTHPIGAQHLPVRPRRPPLRLRAVRPGHIHRTSRRGNDARHVSDHARR